MNKIYFINLDIQNSTLLWRCSETEMIEAFVKEWFIIYEWYQHLKSNSVNINLTGQFGDEWRFTINANYETVVQYSDMLMNTLQQYINVPKYDKNNLDNPILCDNTRKSISRGILFRIGIDETEQSAIYRESECSINSICIKDKKYQLSNTNNLQINTFPEVNDVFVKKKLFYVFLYHRENDKIKEYVEGLKGSFIKTKFYDKEHKMKISSITFDNMDKYTNFIIFCKKYNLLYSNSYGDVYAVNKSSKYKKMFLKQDDVYGDHINTAAKVLINLIKSNDKKQNKDCIIM